MQVSPYSGRLAARLCSSSKESSPIATGGLITRRSGITRSGSPSILPILGHASMVAIDFDEAQVLWKDARMLEAPVKTDDEPRVLVIGKIGDNYWAAVCAHRGDTVRIISVRRARKQEIDHYESQ